MASRRFPQASKRYMYGPYSSLTQNLREPSAKEPQPNKSNARSIVIQNQPFAVQAQMREAAIRDRYNGVRKRHEWKTELRGAHAERVESARFDSATILVQECLLVRQLQRFLGINEAQVVCTVVWLQHEVDVVLAALVVDGVVAERELAWLHGE